MIFAIGLAVGIAGRGEEQQNQFTIGAVILCAVGFWLCVRGARRNGGGGNGWR